MQAGALSQRAPSSSMCRSLRVESSVQFCQNLVHAIWQPFWTPHDAVLRFLLRHILKTTGRLKDITHILLCAERSLFERKVVLGAIQKCTRYPICTVPPTHD